MSASTSTRQAAALLIGIGNYARADRIAALRYAERDARSLASVLVDPGLCAFPRQHVKLLTDHKANRSSIVRHLNHWLPQHAQDADLVLIYFAGHGTVERFGGREEGYLLPHDVDPGNILSHGVAMGDVARWIDALPARAVLVCLDCCHAGGILPAEGLSLRGDRDMQIQPSLLQKLGGRGRFVITSCDKGQKSIEADEFRHGLFTYHLLRGLRGAGDRDGDGKVGIAELFGYVSQAVSNDARARFQREQTPWTWATYNEEVVLATVQPRAEPTVHPPSTVDEEKPAGAEADGDLLSRLRALERHPRLDELPFVFAMLGHANQAVRQRAQQALAALDWEAVTRKVEELARQNEAESLGAVLDGLAALETHARVVALLDRLAGLLRGGLRDRAEWLLDRKRLAQEREKLAGIFRDTRSIYDIIRVLGPGTYTGAYLARMNLTGLDVVVRVLRPEYANQPRIRSHFLDLGTRAVRLVHQNLVLTREAGAIADRELYYIVRDYIPGATLREILEAGRRFEPLQVCKILRQVLDALSPLHRDGLVHAGIKPSNIFFTRDDRVILGDPSLPIPATGWDLPRLAYDFRYCPPELFRSPPELTPGADFYSLGCVAHELFRGQPPFVAENHYELIARHSRDAVPAPGGGVMQNLVHHFLERLLDKSATNRFDKLEQALEALARLENALRLGPERIVPPADRPSLPPPPTATLAHGAMVPPASVHLLREQSLMQFDGRQSIVPLTQGGGPSAGHESFAEPATPEIPGYQILETLGRGGMGVVYKALDQRLQREVALKMVLSGAYAGAEEQSRFLTEARAIARLQHPNIVQIHELGSAAGNPFIALEYCEGGSLARRLSQPLAPIEAARLVETLARAVHHAHSQNVIHRDLKPGNVLFTRDGLPKITDFGLARQLDKPGHTQTGAVIGTPSYMAPEQARGDSSRVGPATDIYALGAILYECLTGRPPFKAEAVFDTVMQVLNEAPVPPSRLDPAVPAALDRICLRCLQKEPSARYGTAKELAEALYGFVEGALMTAAPRRSGWSGWWPFGRK